MRMHKEKFLGFYRKAGWSEEHRMGSNKRGSKEKDARAENKKSVRLHLDNIGRGKLFMTKEIMFTRR